MTIRLLEEPDESLPAYQPDSCRGRLETDDLKKAAQSRQIRHTIRLAVHPSCGNSQG